METEFIAARRSELCEQCAREQLQRSAGHQRFVHPDRSAAERLTRAFFRRTILVPKSDWLGEVMDLQQPRFHHLIASASGRDGD